MQTDLTDQVIAHASENTASNAAHSTLDLENIQTPELGLLSPRRSEIAPLGPGRDDALIAYSERLRHSYLTNEAGIRDGMLKLGEAFRDGQAITVSCFCRGGQICHADIVKMAIEKVGRSLMREARHDGEGREQTAPTLPERVAADLRTNPRTVRAINEILSVGRSDLILAKLDDTEGRNRSEHASHLNGQSQFVRDLYERGATVRDGALISPKENPASSTPPLTVATNEYALKKLSVLTDESRAKELAPQILEYGQKIAGLTADRDTKIKVFNWIYGALEGRNEFLKVDERAPVAETTLTKEEQFEKTLSEIASLAEEMSKLEPSERSVQFEQLIETESVEREANADDLLPERVYEEAILLEDQTTHLESALSLGSTQEFERVELPDTTLSRLAGDMSKEQLDRWTEVRLPVLDELLESGTLVDEILKPFENSIYYASKDGDAEKRSAVVDLRFASAYIDHQLKQPESRLRHLNSRYRSYAAMLDEAISRDQVMDAASKIRLENAKVGFQWNTLPEKEKAKTPLPLTAKEMQFLFTEVSPRHYTTEMTAAKLSYMSVGTDTKEKTEALMRGEIAPSPEAAQLIESLEARLGRRQLKDSISATRHFFQSLKTTNAELRYKNDVDHSEIYRKLPPAEKDFVYQRAVLQKESLETKLFDKTLDSKTLEPALSAKLPTTDFKAFRQELKTRFTEFVRTSTSLGERELSEGVASILETSLKGNLKSNVDRESVNGLSRELTEDLVKRSWTNESRSHVGIAERAVEKTGTNQSRIHDAYIR